jgi:hypothetical protein
MNSAEARVRQCLDRIQTRQRDIRAWAYIDPD